MKRMLVAGAISTLALIGVPAAASAAPADAACFGGIHKAINTEGLLGLDNVGQAVKALGGPGKNATATAACGG